MRKYKECSFQTDLPALKAELFTDLTALSTTLLLRVKLT
ncbi:hypothetical protein ACPOL_2777 [Acidisarcina polymorpha]|uniref:Uncharacterized protein n=1 Tax=Acidisarcina polymorpha TaxID=2211140 RepID=A0A2Z5G0B7_9BACT|nr:hypothetical protein ACPOL_2777 [Acidisarcina polymorpha]